MYFLQCLSLLTNDTNSRKKWELIKSFTGIDKGRFLLLCHLHCVFFWPLTHLPLSPLGERSWITGEKGSTTILNDTALC